MPINRRAVIGASTAILPSIAAAAVSFPVSDRRLFDACEAWRQAKAAFRGLEEGAAFDAAVERADGLARRALTLRATSAKGVALKLEIADELVDGFHDDVVYEVIESLFADLREAHPR